MMTRAIHSARSADWLHDTAAVRPHCIGCTVQSCRQMQQLHSIAMLKSFLLLSLVLWTSNSASAQEKAPVVISYQGAVYWALPIYIAQERGYFDTMNLDVSYEVYTSGDPQVAAAVENMTWDIGAAGVVPNIIGGPQDIETIGISNDESATNALVGNAASVAAWPPANISDYTIALTANSTVHYAIEACLTKEAYNLMDANFSFAAPADVLAALNNGTADYGGLWAPNLYLFLENSEESAIVCSGADAGATIPGGIMVRKDFGESNPETVAKVLAAWLRGIEFIKDNSNRATVLEYMKTFYGTFNVTISEQAMEQEIDLRPIFGLDQQLFMMKRGGDEPSTVDRWYQGVANFMFNAGMLDEDVAVDTYITDKYMQLVANDTNLRFFALREEIQNTTITSGSFSICKCMYLVVSGVMVVGWSFL